MSQEPITTYCPTCGKAFRVPADLQGKKIACKSCQTHFVVQADKPGIPAAHPPAAHAPAAPAAPAQASHAQPAHGTPPPPEPHAARTHPAAVTAKAPPAPPSNPPVSAATSAPAPGPQVVDELAPIPFDDAPVSRSVGGAAPADQTVSTRGQKLEKVKIESKGPYYVVKLVLAGKMVHVNIEDALNEYAADGWRLREILTTPTGEAYAILYREQDGQKNPESPSQDSH